MNATPESNSSERNNSCVPLTPEQQQKLQQAFKKKFNSIQNFLQEWCKRSNTLGNAPREEDVENILYGRTSTCKYWMIEGCCQILLNRSYRDYSTKPVAPALKQELQEKLKELKLKKRYSWGDFSKLWADQLNDLNPPTAETIRKLLKPERDSCEYWVVNGLCQILLNCSYEQWIKQCKKPDLQPENTPQELPSLPQKELGETVATDDSSSNVKDEEANWLADLADAKIANQCQDWGEAVDVSVFFGRQDELIALERWIISDRCRLVALLGMGGMGKTALSVKLAENIQQQFDYVIWRSLRNAPPIEGILAELIQFLSNQSETGFLGSIAAQRLRLINYLKQSRCLVILDNFESVLVSGKRAGLYKEGYEEYGELLLQVGESRHQSCLVITSREKPKEIASLEGEKLPVRSFKLRGLGLKAREIFESKGFAVSASDYRKLIKLYQGNPLALKIASTTVKEVFNGSVSQFLSESSAVFGDINELLARQFNRLSNFEKEAMYWLAIERNPATFGELKEDTLSLASKQKLQETVESLLDRRSLIEKTAGKFTQQPVVMEYVTEQLIEKVYEEIIAGEIEIFNSHSLLKAQAKDYVRESQIHLILKLVLDRLLADNSKKNVKEQLLQVLSPLRDRTVLTPGYACGNVLNLLAQLQIDLSDYDFSHLTVWQAYLQEVNLHRVNFANSDLAHSTFSDIFGSIISLYFSPDRTLLAIGDANGELHLWHIKENKKLFTYKVNPNSWVRAIAFHPTLKIVVTGGDEVARLWDIETGQCLKTFRGHKNKVESVAFSPDGLTVASGGGDNKIKHWDIATGKCLKTYSGHKSWIRSVAFHPQLPVIASGSEDQTIKLWDITTGKCLKTCKEHKGQIWAVAFSPDEVTLASGSSDHTVKLWNINSGQCLKTFQGQTAEVWSIAFSPDGLTLASGSRDKVVRLWNVSTLKCFKTLEGHASWIWSVAFHPHLPIIASGSEDRTVKLWDASTGERLKTLRGYNNEVWSIAFSPDGQTLANGSGDHTVKLWNVSTGQRLRIFKGHTGRVWSVAFHPHLPIIASGSEDQTVKLWDSITGDRLKSLRGHTDGIRAIAFSPNGEILASASDDGTVRIWDATTGEHLKTLHHNTGVWAIAFHPQLPILASGSGDKMVRLWDITTEQCLKTFSGHIGRIWSVAYSPDGLNLASGSDDKTVKLWNIETGKYLNLQEQDWVWSVAFSPDGRILASGSDDMTASLWDTTTGKLIQTFPCHTSRVRAVAFQQHHEHGLILATSSDDETIKLWDINTGTNTVECLKILSSPKPYEGMNITGVTGLTEATIATLKTLGAVSNLE
jgi:WD40 repeat protein